ncbi:DUF4062 domain-containing protein [Hymenobacter aquaticus]|uniref:DUF4062 domain-containing protein n=1 Tax=Hymenobacter aquaticus TaxID=1867101 RepID=A0A4Z0Q6B3_9BACT|nr:DUF4062 domain-containing protein [Hymenobacter aquaticus]TGE25194.1 DUF4062 domain-containing protein [Hymenobacter aquaticus]
MPTSKPILLVSSAVFGYEELLDRLYAILDKLGFEVWMSHKGTLPIDPNISALESCRKAVARCDYFLSIILPRYGSGREGDTEESITHQELREAIRLKKPRWVLAHDHVVFARGLLRSLGFKTAEDRKSLTLKGTPIFDDLRLIDMYELASRNDILLLKDRQGNWVQQFSTDGEVLLFASSQFQRFQEAEAFVKESLGKASRLKKAIKPSSAK